MAILLEANKPTEVKPAPYPRGFENEFARLLEAMVSAMSKQFENQTLKKLNQGTINKFEDAQVGNYAAVFQTLSKRAQRNIKKRFSNARLKKEVRRIMLSMNRMNQKTFYGNVEDKLGISVQQLINNEGLGPNINALILETEQWVAQLRDDTLARFSANTVRVMTQGASFEEVLTAYREEAGKRKDHAKFIARNQIANFNGLSNKIRFQKLGIKKVVWQTSQDERVRESHKVRNGKEFDLSEGLYSSLDGKHLLPGVDYQCRCIAVPVIPGEENNG